MYVVSSAVTPSQCNDGDVQLVDGTTEYKGRVEVCVNGVWSTVCAYSGWYSNAARIVCSQIGALTKGLHNRNFILVCITLLTGYNYGTVSDIGFAQGSGVVLLGYLSCNGDETNLLNCDQNYYHTNTQSHCQSHYYDAAIVCERKNHYFTPICTYYT